jgi:non-heme chloroperoxidase
VPTLIVHGDDDQIVPIGASAHLSSKLVKDATLKVYPGAPHGLASVGAYKGAVQRRRAGIHQILSPSSS